MHQVFVRHWKQLSLQWPCLMITITTWQGHPMCLVHCLPNNMPTWANWIMFDQSFKKEMIQQNNNLFTSHLTFFVALQQSSEYALSSNITWRAHKKTIHFTKSKFYLRFLCIAAFYEPSWTIYQMHLQSTNKNNANAMHQITQCALQASIQQSWHYTRLKVDDNLLSTTIA